MSAVTENMYINARLHLQYVNIDVKEWMRYECWDEGTKTQNIRNSSILVHMRQKKKIALEIAAKVKQLNLRRATMHSIGKA
jgi:hypothetical protein